MTGLKKVFIIWLIVIAILHVLSRLGGMAGFWQGYTGLLSAVILLYPPIFMEWNRKKGLDYLNFNVSLLPRDLTILFLTCVIVFPALIVANHFYQGLAFGTAYKGFPSADWMTYFINQFVLVALPEEVFFRGYMQKEFSKIWPAKSKVLGAPFGVACLVTSLLFALSHSLVTFQWWHFSIFFPALVFSWLKEKTGTIWMSAIFHALSNLFSYVIFLSYR